MTPTKLHGVYPMRPSFIGEDGAVDWNALSRQRYSVIAPEVFGATMHRPMT